MEILEYILLGLLLVSAVFIIVAVTLMKSNDEGLSSTIAGGSETYYGKDKSVRKERIIGKWMLIVSIVFAIAVVAVYVIQPDYHQSKYALDAWKEASDWSAIFK